jgi:REP element-mobilizing transposase RayT
MNAKCAYRRRSLRLKHYDYSKAGFYFITICTQDRLYLFGEIVDGMMVLNDAGRMIENWYIELENKFKHINNHEMIIMPNHIHFIVEIVYGGNGIRNAGHTMQNGGHAIQKGGHIGPPLRDNNQYTTVGADLRVCPDDTCDDPYVGDIVQWYKTMTTNAYINMVKNGICPPFNKRVWQRNYYEHVVRDDVDYERIATYILNNPMTWPDDVLSKNI